MKIVLNKCFGGFGLSDEAKNMITELGLNEDNFGYKNKQFRTDPRLVSVVEKLGDAANGRYATLVIEYIEKKDLDKVVILDCDGRESLIIPYVAYKAFL